MHSAEPKHVLVAGAGAVGSAVGGMLAKAGHAVTFLGRAPHMTAVRDTGLEITGIWGHHHVTGIRTVTAIEAIPPDVQLCLVTVKSFDTGALAQALAPRLRPEAVVLSLQNGVGNAEAIAAALGWPATLAGMVIIGFEIPAPGRVRVTVAADTVKIGRLDGTMDAAVVTTKEALAGAGIPCDAVPNVNAYLWGKVLYNAALNPLGALRRVPYGDLVQPEPWTTIEQVIGEAFACLGAAGIAVFWRTADEYLAYLRDYQIPRTARHRSSMLQDVTRGRRTEIDFLNGAIVALGRAHGVPTPVNAALVKQIKALEGLGRQSPATLP